MNVLVIGGSYFVGRSIVEHLLADNHTVSVLNRGTQRVSHVEQITVDRNDLDKMPKILYKREFDWVIDTSCYTGEQAETAQSGLKGQYDRWVHISSAAVYAENDNYPITEDYPTGWSEQWKEYGEGKLDAERVLCSLKGTRPITIFRPPYIYGPGNHLEREKWIWPRLLQGRPVLVPNDGETSIQFLHTDDLYSSVRRVLTGAVRNGVSIYNVGEDMATSFCGFINTLASVAEIEANIVKVPYRRLGYTSRDFFPFRDYPCVLDVTRVQNELGWSAEIDLQTGLKQTFDSYDLTELLTQEINDDLEKKIWERCLKEQL